MTATPTHCRHGNDPADCPKCERYRRAHENRKNVTTGDQYECECPACGGTIRDLWDLGNELCSGSTIDCSHCGREIEIVSVEMTCDVTLRAERNRTEPT